MLQGIKLPTGACHLQPNKISFSAEQETSQTFVYQLVQGYKCPIVTGVDTTTNIPLIVCVKLSELCGSAVQAAAAMDVHIGSFSDPEELPGLAHFLGIGILPYIGDTSSSLFKYTMHVISLAKQMTRANFLPIHVLIALWIKDISSISAITMAMTEC